MIQIYPFRRSGIKAMCRQRLSAGATARGTEHREDDALVSLFSVPELDHSGERATSPAIRSRHPSLLPRSGPRLSTTRFSQWPGQADQRNRKNEGGERNSCTLPGDQERGTTRLTRVTSPARRVMGTQRDLSIVPAAAVTSRGGRRVFLRRSHLPSSTRTLYFQLVVSLQCADFACFPVLLFAESTKCESQ